ncbi:hypothetical protein K6Y31_12180 [Motilimonas cestriensis]|uniref:Uncharacterized protein n=1 Tax=Motilimonas cestriensis TaxID=2742685 RepID=A0ABS8WCZ1_9GAMM|nr:hypothetical protein [Motilimonas cestriensis]MCE2595578.1 hypothetical protein [Motilimonas cestriensis]
MIKLGIIPSSTISKNHITAIFNSIRDKRNIEPHIIYINQQSISTLDFEPKLECDIYLIQESNYINFNFIPPESIKIGLPHGLDIPLEKTIKTYGGGFDFDYILSAVEQIKQPTKTYYNDFPLQLRSHQHNSIVEIPFGQPKLDAFIDTVEANQDKKKAIIYHLSYLEIEQDWVASLIKPTLFSLLKSFPEHDIIFRPHHLDRESKLLNDIVTEAREYVNFIYSIADSYIEDYSRGEVMVCHRAYSQHLFGYATGNMSIICKPDDLTETLSINPAQFSDSSIENLTSEIKKIIGKNQPFSRQKIIENCRSEGIHNPGESIKYLVNHLEHIIQNRPPLEWTSYSLNTEKEPLIPFLCLNILSARTANMAFQALCAKFPNWPLGYLLAADSYSRAVSLHDYYYKICLDIFYKLITSDYNLDYDIQAAIDIWWQDKGKSVLAYVLKESAKTTTELPESIRWLSSSFTPAPKKPTNQPTKEKLFNIKKLIFSKPEKPIIMYGSGVTCKQYLTHAPKAIKSSILGISDSNPSKFEQNIEGIKISSFESLRKKEMNQDVIITSHAYVEEIYHQLKGDSALNIYAIAPDDISVLLVNLTLKYGQILNGE